MSKKRIFIITLILCIIASISPFITKLIINKSDAISDSAYTIRVANSPAYTIYLTGKDCAESSLSTSYKEYKVEPNSIITLNVISETRIFTKWNITDATDNTIVSDADDRKIKITVNKSLNVDVVTKEASIDDYGLYYGNPIHIYSSQELIAMEKILAAGNTTSTTTINSLLDQYDILFERYMSYAELSNADKATFIKNQKLFARVQSGCYKLAQNVSLFETNFTGIGTNNTPFNGIICGADGDATSQIVVLINAEETGGTTYYGLFSKLGDHSVIKNIRFNVSVAISASNSTFTNAKMYVGGISGYAVDPLFYNVLTSSSVVVNSNSKTDIIVGNLFGQVDGFEISELNKVKCDSKKSNLVATSKGSISAGYICGKMNSSTSYFKNIKIDIPSYTMNVECNDTTYNSNRTIKAGIFSGEVNKDLEVDNVEISNMDTISVNCNILAGNSYLGGFIGYIDTGTTQNPVNIKMGRIIFRNRSNQPTIIKNSTASSESQANVYTGGMFGYIKGDNLIALEGFKQDVKRTMVGSTVVYEYEPMFTGKYEIKSVQNGKADVNRYYGKCVSGGLVGKGYFNINGTASKPTEIIITNDSNDFFVESVQSSISSHVNFVDNPSNPKNPISTCDNEHCVTGLFTGLISGSKNYEYINIYAQNAKIQTTREIGSLSMGNISIGTFFGYSDAINYESINMYLNNVELNCNSLSYEVKNNKPDTNNSYVGGFVGNYTNSTNNQMLINNVAIKGYDFTTDNVIGSTLGITSVQNTKPGGGDYMGENYVGGVVGCLYKGSITNTNYIGSPSQDSFILMRAHESPDSAFCGGLIGFIKLLPAYNVNIDNNKIEYANIRAEEAVKIAYNNPDIYAGGLIGALYCNGNTNKITINTNKIFNTKVQSVGHEKTDTFAGGICAGFTWNASTTVDILNNMIYNCDIEALVQANTQYDQNNCAYAAGICPSFRKVKATVKNNVVIDTKVSASSSKANSAFVYGLVGRDIANQNGDMVVRENISNARLSSSSGTTFHYPIYYTFSSATDNYYQQDNALVTTSNSGILTPVGTSSYVRINNSTDILPEIRANFSNSSTTFKTNNQKYALKLTEKDNSQFEIESNYLVKPKAGARNVTEFCEVWVNVTTTLNSIFDQNKSDEMLHEEGWYKFATMIIYNGAEPNPETITMINRQVTFFNDLTEYRYVSANDHFVNVNAPYDIISNVNSLYTENLNGASDYNSCNDYDLAVKVYDGMRNFRFKFTIQRQSLSSVYNIFPHFYINGSTTSENVSDEKVGIYGSYKLFKLNDTDTSVDYILELYPNADIEQDAMVTVKFSDGYSGNQIGCILNITMLHNERELIGVTYSPETPPLNYHIEEDMDKPNNYSAPKFYVRSNEKFKLIPVYTTKNDPLRRVIIDARYCNEAMYTLNSTSGGEVDSTGSLTAGSTYDTEFTITVRDKLYTTNIVTATFMVVTEFTIMPNAANTEFTGLLRATQKCSYSFAYNIQNGYGGNFNQFDIVIGSTTYDLLDANCILWQNDNLIVTDENGERINSPNEFKLNNNKYSFLLKKDVINGNITINSSPFRIYEITFDVQTTLIDQANRKKVFYVKEGTNFQEYFMANSDELNSWLDGIKEELFGFVLNGLYFVTDANSIISYGESFANMCDRDNFYVTSSLTFFARWSFLIELIEAPGTNIRTSFPNSFVQYYYDSQTMTRGVIIPINMNKGYVFSVDLDENYIGKPDVKAYSVTFVGGEKKLTEIEVEKYPSNDVLYYVSPDKINGYLVIATSVSNNNFITGTNVAVISDNVVPEDGLFTFRYIVNHYNTADKKSYIYDSGINGDKEHNLNLIKDFKFVVNYEVFDPISGTYSKSVLPTNEEYELEIYYQKIVNGVVTKQVVGNLTLGSGYGQNEADIKMSDFKLLDKDTPAFPEETFRNFLGNNEIVSEIIYLVVTPKNGYAAYASRLHNIVIEAGYVDETREDGFVSGIRTSDDLINIPLDGEDSPIQIKNLKAESSKQIVVYTICPSRQTELIDTTNLEDGNRVFKFTDNTKYSLLEIEMTNIEYDIAQQIIMLKSNSSLVSLLPQRVITNANNNIYSLNLRLGYKVGNGGIVKVYGSSDGIDFGTGDSNLVKTINVTSSSYELYEIPEFRGCGYTCFKIIAETSDNICVKTVEIVREENGIKDVFDEINARNVTRIDSNTLRYNFAYDIENDDRHLGKSFMLAIEFKDGNNNVINNIENTIQLRLCETTMNEHNHKFIDPVINNINGRTVVYFNLSSALNLLPQNVNSYEFTIITNNDYIINTIQLIEVENPNKPAMGEVRYSKTF